MIGNVLKISEKKEFYWVISIAIGIQVLLSFQGFEVCDEGFSLTFYQQLFNDPSSVEYCFVYWLSGLIGGLWYHLYPEGGILWFRILAIIFNTATLILGYKILKNYMNSRYVLIGLLMVLFVNDYGFLAFYHNHLTAFLALLGMYFLLKGIRKERLILLLISGCILGINIFTRIPNVTLLIFVLAIPYANYQKHRNFAKIVRPTLAFAFGVIVGILSVVTLLYYLNQWHIMKKALSALISLGEAGDSSHNLIGLLRNYVVKHIMVFAFFCKFLIICVIIFSSKNYFKGNLFVTRMVQIFGFLIFALLFDKGGIHMVYALSYLGVLGILLIKQEDKHLMDIALLAFLMMLVLPLGSGGSISSSGYMCIWLAPPFFLHFMASITSSDIILKTKFHIVTTHVSKDFFKQLTLVLVLAFFTEKAYSISQEAYFDKGSRFEKIYPINNKYARGIFTSKERATIINDLLTELNEHVKPNDYVLFYDNAPMLYFLTNTRPYMFNPWVWIYDSSSFEKQLERAQVKISVLPIVVQQKFNTIYEFSDPMSDYMSEAKENTNDYNQGRTIATNRFLNKYDYEIVWSNDYFNIYKPNKKL